LNNCVFLIGTLSYSDDSLLSLASKGSAMWRSRLAQTSVICLSQSFCVSLTAVDDPAASCAARIPSTAPIAFRVCMTLPLAVNGLPSGVVDTIPFPITATVAVATIITSLMTSILCSRLLINHQPSGRMLPDRAASGHGLLTNPLTNLSFRLNECGDKSSR
jgi:hypothetical protein